MTEIFEFLMKALKSKFIGTIELNFMPSGDIKVSYSRKNIKHDELTKIPL